MGNKISSSMPTFLLQAERHQPQDKQPQDDQPQDNFTTDSTPTSASNPFRRHKPFKTKPDLKDPALEGYVAGWRQTDFDDDAQEFSFATFQQGNHHDNTTLSGYEGDDERDEAVERDMKLGREEFETLDRERGLGRSGSYGEREMKDNSSCMGCGGVDCGGCGEEEDVRTLKEMKMDEQSLEKKLHRVRRKVADEHALPRTYGRDVVGTRG